MTSPDTEGRREVRPTDETLMLVAFLRGGREEGTWVSADEIRHAVARLGFPMPSSQWVGARLRVLCGQACPLFERQLMPFFDIYEYRVTGYAMNALRNTWPRFDPLTFGSIRLPDLPLRVYPKEGHRCLNHSTG